MIGHRCGLPVIGHTAVKVLVAACTLALLLFGAVYRKCLVANNRHSTFVVLSPVLRVTSRRGLVLFVVPATAGAIRVRHH
jgi:membrane-associated PAP2 superfamily phosphatase